MDLLQESIKQYLEERNWHDNPPSDLAKSVSIEAAELLEHFQWGSPSADEVKQDPNKLVEISMEIADVIIYAIELCIVLGLDYKKVVNHKLAEVELRYPVNQVNGDNRNNYMKIKKLHRENRKSNDDLHQKRG